jgi:hypothetical protein
MARLKGPILFTGSLGNIRSIYNKKLKRYVLSTKGGASKDLIKNSPTFARTRENMSEFAACGKWSSLLRKALLSISHLFFGFYFSEIVKLAKQIQLRDESHAKGSRSLESSKIPELLTTLNFNRSHSFNSVISDFPAIAFSEDKRKVTLTLSSFKSSLCIHWPVRFDSYRIALVIAQLPDFVYNEEEAAFIPVIPDLEQLSVITYSEWLPNNSEPRDIFLDALFPEPALQQPGTTVIVAMAIEISSSLLKPTDSYTSNEGTMKIVACFV